MPPLIPPPSFPQTSERHLDQLVLEGRYAEAAALCPTVLHGSETKWEWWVQAGMRVMLA